MGLRLNFRLKNPMIPATKEESRITNLALLMILWLSKAKRVMKIDMVKPMPPKKPTAINDFQLILEGSLQMPNVTAKKVNKKMPNGLPTISPSAMPIL